MKGFYASKMNLRWRLAGEANKPPCGAIVKRYGVERSRKRWINPSGKNNGDELK